MLAVVALECGFEEPLLRPELGIHRLAIDPELVDEHGGAGVGVAVDAEELDGGVEKFGAVVLLHGGGPVPVRGVPGFLGSCA